MSAKESSSPRRDDDFWVGWFEVTVALVLGLAILGSAWSTYQSSLWDGIQDFRIAEALASGRQAAEKSVLASQLRGIDVMLFERYASAVGQNNERFAEFLFQRFRPEFRPAVKAWLDTKPLKNPQAPSSPFVMKEYSLSLEKEVQQLRRTEEKSFAEAKAANQYSDAYLLVTVGFSTVLFLVGTAGAFDRRRLQVAVLILGVLTLTVASSVMAFMPVAAK
jgi:hypothetical protein